MPHLSARLVVDRAHLAELVAPMAELGVRDVFVVAGDADEPAGSFTGAAELLDAMAELGHPFEEIGITGYPESHPIIDDETTIAAMFEKSRHATYIASQICFDSRVTVAWIDNVWSRGTRLPILVGIPGMVPRAKLMRVSTRIGIGESLRYLRKHGDFVTRFLKPGGFSPDKLIKGLGPALASSPEQRIGGFHIFTFNDLADTEAWRQRKLAGGSHDRALRRGDRGRRVGGLCAREPAQSRDPSTRVLVLEAGRPDYAVRRLPPHAGRAGVSPIGSQPLRLGLPSEPEPFLHGRRVYHARGKVLGGSSSINGMIFQRGNALDYERWGDRSGHGQVGLRPLSPVLQADGDLPRGADDRFGAATARSCSSAAPPRPAARGVLRCRPAGRLSADRRRERLRQEGFAPFDRNVHEGRRLSAARAYLHP